MKKLLLTILTISAVSFSNPSKALVGLASNDDGIALLGLAFMDISQVVIVDRTTVYRSRTSRVTYSAFRVVTYIPLALFGLFMLDEQGNEQIGEITPAMKDKYQLTANEFEELNNPTTRDMVNSMLQDVGHLISNEKGRAAQIKVSQLFWKQNELTLTPEAFSGLKKIAIGNTDKGPIGDK